jgi:hypothetical protein
VYVLAAGLILQEEPGLCLGFASDITAQKETERAALKATQSKSLFLANVSHGIFLTEIS